jgi:hypothetical protein
MDDAPRSTASAPREGRGTRFPITGGGGPPPRCAGGRSGGGSVGGR